MTKISKNQFAKRNCLSLFAAIFCFQKKVALSLVPLLVLFLSSCVTRDESHGYMFEMADSHLLESGITSRQQVAKIMGSPTIISNFGAEELWIYYAEKSETLMFLKPKIVSREIITIAFDNNDIAKRVKRIGLDDEEKDLQFSPNKTSVPDHKVGFFKAIFSNVGQIKPQ